MTKMNDLLTVQAGGPGSGPQGGGGGRPHFDKDGKPVSMTVPTKDEERKGHAQAVHDTVKDFGFKQNHSGVYEKTGRMGPKGQNTHYVHVADDGKWSYHRKGELSRGSGGKTRATGEGMESLEKHLSSQKDLA